MGDLTIDRAQLEIVIKNDDSRRRIRELEEDSKSLTKEMRQLEKQGKKDTAEWNAKAAALKRNKNEMDGLVNQIGLTGLSMKELKKRQGELNAIMNAMDPRTAEYKKLEEHLKSVNNRVSELKSRYNNVQTSMQGMNNGLFSQNGIIGKVRTSYFAAAGALYGFIAGIKSAITSYKEEEKAIKKVQQSIISTSGAAGLSLSELRNEASRLQNETIFGDETILNDATAQLLTFTNIAGDNFKRAQVAAMDLSTVLDGDLKASSILLGKALNDPVQGLTYLRRVGISFTESQIATIKSLAETNHLAEAQTLILDELAKQYGGQAKAAAAGAGALDQAKNTISDLGETVGKYLITAFYPFINAISDVASSLNKWISIPISGELEKEQSKVNALSTALMDKNISLKERNAYYNELKRIAPEVIKNIDSESISVGTLAKNLSLYNEQMVLKILLQRKEEKIATLLEDQADAFEKVTTQTEKLSVSINKVYSDFVVQDGASKYFAINMKAMYMAGRISIDEYAESLFKLAEREKISLGNASAGSIALMGLQRAQGQYKEATEEVFSLEKEKVEFMQKNGLKSFINISKAVKEDTDDTKENANSKKELVTELDILNNRIKAAQSQLEQFASTGNIDEAMKAGILLDQLKESKKYIDAIIAAGGDLEAVIDKLRMGFTDENLKNAGKDPVGFIDDTLSWLDTNVQPVDVPDMEPIKDPLFNQDFYLDQVKVVSGAAFDIWKNNADARLDYELSALDKAMNRELSNKNLTEDQKDKIREKYAKKERAIKTEQFKKQKAADIIRATIDGILAVIKAGVLTPLGISTAIANAAQIAVIAAQPVPQFAKGKYMVQGADDGRKYAAQWVGTPRTGLYTRPSLFAENGGEIIIDAPTTSRMRANAPQLINAIYQMAGKVPQRSEGKYDISGLTGVSAGADGREFIRIINKLDDRIDKFDQTMGKIQEKGIKSKIVYTDLQDFSKKVDDIEQQSSF